MVSNSSESLCHIPWSNSRTQISCHYSLWIITLVSQLLGLITFNVFCPLPPWHMMRLAMTLIIPLEQVLLYCYLLFWSLPLPSGFYQFFRSTFLSTFLPPLFPASCTRGSGVHHYTHTLSKSLSPSILLNWIPEQPGLSLGWVFYKKNRSNKKKPSMATITMYPSLFTLLSFLWWMNRSSSHRWPSAMDSVSSCFPKGVSCLNCSFSQLTPLA